MQDRKISLVNQVISYLLWLISTGLGLYTIYALHNLAGTIYALFGKDYYTGVLIGQVVAVVFGLVWVIVFVMIGEFLFKHAGERISWRLFAWVFGFELLVILLGLFLG